MELPGHPDRESRSLGHIRWYDATRKTGVIDCPDTTSVRIQCADAVEAPPALPTNQLVTFVLRHTAQGPYATDVRPIKRVPPDVEPRLLAQIAVTLHERGRQPLAQIQQLITVLGPERVLALVAETLRIEAAGGMLLPDGSRRRTSGGVFFRLAYDALTDDQRAHIFPPRVWPKKGASPASPVVASSPASPAVASSPAPPAALTWDVRRPLVETGRTAPGKATTVKVTIIGRPDRVIERAQCTLLVLKHNSPLPALPKGVPVPAKVPDTFYAVYIGKKQWKQVAEAIQNPDDVLIVEGVQIYDAEAKAITVFATKATTKLLQQAQRQAKPETPAAEP